MAIRKIISIDFDGVLHSYRSGWQGADHILDAPVPGAIEWLTDLLRDDHFDVQIFSSRNHQPGGIQAMSAWLLDNGLDPDLIDDIGFPLNKPAAHLTIDDRAFCFTGTFPATDEIDEFNPWFKGGWNRTAELEERLHKADGMANEINILVRENRVLREAFEAIEKLLPHIHENNMEGESDYERAVLNLEAALAKARGG